MQLCGNFLKVVPGAFQVPPLLKCGREAPFAPLYKYRGVRIEDIHQVVNKFFL
jgi:hypothetical protein